MQYKILHQLDPQLFCAELLVFEKSAVMFEALYWLLFKDCFPSPLFCFLLVLLQSPLRWWAT